VSNLKLKEVSFISTLTSLLDAKASRIVERVDDLGRETADSLHAAAVSIRKCSKAIEDFGESTADKLDGAGSYVEKHDLKRAIGESRRIVRRYAVAFYRRWGGLPDRLRFSASDARVR